MRSKKDQAATSLFTKFAVLSTRYRHRNVREVAGTCENPAFKYQNLRKLAVKRGWKFRVSQHGMSRKNSRVQDIKTSHLSPTLWFRKSILRELGAKKWKILGFSNFFFQRTKKDKNVRFSVKDVWQHNLLGCGNWFQVQRLMAQVRKVPTSNFHPIPFKIEPYVLLAKRLRLAMTVLIFFAKKILCSLLWKTLFKKQKSDMGIIWKSKKLEIILFRKNFEILNLDLKNGNWRLRFQPFCFSGLLQNFVITCRRWWEILKK